MLRIVRELYPLQLKIKRFLSCLDLFGIAEKMEAEQWMDIPELVDLSSPNTPETRV